MSFRYTHGTVLRGTEASPPWALIEALGQSSFKKCSYHGTVAVKMHQRCIFRALLTERRGHAVQIVLGQDLRWKEQTSVAATNFTNGRTTCGPAA